VYGVRELDQMILVVSDDGNLNRRGILLLAVMLGMIAAKVTEVRTIGAVLGWLR
jgi:hypothetical protein